MTSSSVTTLSTAANATADIKHVNITLFAILEIYYSDFSRRPSPMKIVNGVNNQIEKQIGGARSCDNPTVAIDENKTLYDL
jgi:hypothetical protein